jgi:hypothetical protein
MASAGRHAARALATRCWDRTGGTPIVGDNAIVRHTFTGETERDGKINPVTIGVLMVWSGTSQTGIGSCWPGKP